jgi:hypothetical protein
MWTFVHLQVFARCDRATRSVKDLPRKRHQSKPATSFYLGNQRLNLRNPKHHWEYKDFHKLGKTNRTALKNV